MAMHTKFPSSVIIMGIVIDEELVKPPQVFLRSFRLNAIAYIEMVKTVINPWTEGFALDRT